MRRFCWAGDGRSDCGLNREEYLAFQKERIAKVTLIMEEIYGGLPGIFTAEEFPKFLSFFARWNHYPALNVVLLYMRCPHATYLAGFQRWKELALEQGRSEKYPILKVEQRKNGIPLLIPFSLSDLERGRIAKRYLEYHSVLVFDVSQVHSILTPPVFSPFVDLRSYGFREFCLILRYRLQNQVSILPGVPHRYFRLGGAYIEGNKIFYNGALGDQEKAEGILEQVIRFHGERLYGKDASFPLILYAATYMVFSFFQFPVESFRFEPVAELQKEPPEVLLHLLSAAGEIMKKCIFEVYMGHQAFLRDFVHPEEDQFLRQLEERLYEEYNKE